MYTLPELNLLKVNEKKVDEKSSTFIFEPLSPGYGMTIGNALRRVLLTSLGGSAITSAKIEGATHEFSTLPGLKEDIVEIILNLKSFRVKLVSGDEAILKLSKKGQGKVLAKDFAKNSQVEIVDPEFVIANLDKKGKLEMEVKVEKGKGYVPTESRKDENLPLGVIAIDSIFTPMRKVHYEVENTRVEGITNFDKLTIDITTDGTIEPEKALKDAAKILLEHFDFVSRLGKIETDNSKVKNLKTKKTSTKKQLHEIELTKLKTDTHKLDKNPKLKISNSTKKSSLNKSKLESKNPKAKKAK